MTVAAAVARFVRDHAHLDRVALLQALIHEFPTATGAELQAGLDARPRPILGMPKRPVPP